MRLQTCKMSFTISSSVYAAVILAAVSAAASDKCAPCSCGLIGPNGPGRRGRIIGGQMAIKGELPWLAAVFMDGKLICGATLISSKHLITAAHCVRGANITSLGILVGHYDLSDGQWNRLERISRIQEHPKYNRYNFDNDIAVIRLMQQLPDDLNVPICLPSKLSTDGLAGRSAMIVGWGSTKEKGPQTNTPRKASVDIWSFGDCEDGYGSSKITSRMLCAAASDTDSCTGDSGGPLLLGFPHTIVGVVSYGRGCGRADYPGVYTRVDQYLPWIESQVEHECACVPKI